MFGPGAGNLSAVTKIGPDSPSANQAFCSAGSTSRISSHLHRSVAVVRWTRADGWAGLNKAKE